MLFLPRGAGQPLGGTKQRGFPPEINPLWAPIDPQKKMDCPAALARAGIIRGITQEEAYARGRSKGQLWAGNR